MHALAQLFWRLIPANPILLRVVATAGKRRRDALIRFTYLGLIAAWVGLTLLGLLGTSDLGKLASTSCTIFKNASYLQLILVSMLAPIFTAGAITQEKDSQTYDILLSTPLTNAQVVLGTLLSRVFFVIALLLSGIPVFSVMRIFGGVGMNNIMISFGIAAATAFVTGALAIAIATFKVGTRRTIFFFYLSIVGYLIGLWLLDQSSWFQIAGHRPISTEDSHISWFTGMHPFLALRASMGDVNYTPPLAAELPEALRAWPLRWYFTNPHSFYITASFVFGMTMIVPSVFMLRRIAQSTFSFKNWLLARLHIIRSENARKPRYVWHNPVAWREAKTKASAARMGILRALLILTGLALACAILWRFSIVVSPAQYIDANSINTETHTVTLLLADRSSTYHASPNLEVTLKGKKISPEQIHGRYAVNSKDFTLDPRDKNLVIAIGLTPIQRAIDVKTAQSWLLALLLLEIAVVLIVVTNEAASTVTREREDGSLDLLLTTPITSRFYVWGKLRGLVSLAWPLNAVPIASMLLFVVYDTFRWIVGSDSTFQWVVFPEALFLLPPMLVLVTALAGIIGMHTSMRCRTTITAVMLSVTIVGVAVAIPAMIGFATISSSDYSSVAPLAVASFSPVSVLCVLAGSATFGGEVLSGEFPDAMFGGRMTVVIFAAIACGAYAAILFGMHKSMVKNFDMMIRKQQK